MMNSRLLNEHGDHQPKLLPSLTQMFGCLLLYQRTSCNLGSQCCAIKNTGTLSHYQRSVNCGNSNTQIYAPCGHNDHLQTCPPMGDHRYCFALRSTLAMTTTFMLRPSEPRLTSRATTSEPPRTIRLVDDRNTRRCRDCVRRTELRDIPPRFRRSRVRQRSGRGYCRW